jgi:hypothetical protein
MYRKRAADATKRAAQAKDLSVRKAFEEVARGWRVLEGQEDEALKFMRAAADVEDNSEKHVAMLAQHYDCSGFGGRDRGRSAHGGPFWLFFLT